MASSWTAHPLLARPRPACGVAERHPSSSGTSDGTSRSVARGPHPTGQQRHQPAGAVTRRSLNCRPLPLQLRDLVQSRRPQWSSSLPPRCRSDTTFFEKERSGHHAECRFALRFLRATPNQMRSPSDRRRYASAADLRPPPSRSGPASPGCASRPAASGRPRSPRPPGRHAPRCDGTHAGAGP
jgi:hypothetical protein